GAGTRAEAGTGTAGQADAGTRSGADGTGWVRRRIRRIRRIRPRPSSCAPAGWCSVYQAVTGRGPRVPPDIGVVDSDDPPRARWITPALTTVRQPLPETAGDAPRRARCPGC
ncbi:LacI family transcriptional regulator, partial [Streptomyces hygroscopicus]